MTEASNAQPDGTLETGIRNEDLHSPFLVALTSVERNSRP